MTLAKALAVLAALTIALAASPASATNAVPQSPTLAAGPTPGQYYQMRARSSGLRLEVAFASTGLAPVIQASSPSGYRPSHWRFESINTSFYRIINRNSGNCLRGSSAGVRTVIYQAPCQGGNIFDEWRLTQTGSDYEISQREFGWSLCIIGDLTFGGVPLVSESPGSSLCNKRFTLIPVS